MNTKSVFSSLALLLTAMVWGLSFVAQSVGMDSIGPLTFNYARYFMAFVVLIPISAPMPNSPPSVNRVEAFQ